MQTSNWVLIQSVLSDGNNTPYYLTEPFASFLSENFIVSLQPPSQSGTMFSSSFWMFTFDSGNMGRIRSQLYSGYVLSVDANNNVIIEQEVQPTPPRQQWTLNNAWDSQGNGIGCYEIKNIQSGFMSVNPTDLTTVTIGTPVVAGQAGLGSNQAFQWCLSPNTILQDIANLPNYNNGSVPSFPPFTNGNQPEAYSTISNALASGSGGDIRSMYTGTDIDWGIAYTNLKTPPISDNSGGSNIDNSDWMPVVNQLEQEIQPLSNMHLLLNNINGLTDILSSVNQAGYNSVIADTGLTPTSSNNIGMQMQGIIQNLAFSLLSASGPEGGVAAAIMQAAIGVGKIQAPSLLLPSPKTIAISELWSNLLLSLTGDQTTNTPGILKCLATYFEAVLSDWNKLQAASRLLGTTSWPVTLLTTTDTIPNAVDASASWCKLTALQAILPTMYSIYIIDEDAGDFPSYVPSFAQFTGLGRNMFVAASSSPATPIPQKLINDLWGPNGAGANQADFFNGSNGWYLPRSFQGRALGYSVEWTLTIANMTPNILTAQMVADWGAYQFLNQSLQVLPNESVTFLGPVTSETVPGSPTQVMGYSCSLQDFSQKTVLSFNASISGGDGLLNHAYIAINSVQGNGVYTCPITMGGESNISHDTTAAGMVPVFLT